VRSLLPTLRLRALALGLLAVAACSDPPSPPYTRLEGPAPAVDRLPAGGVLVAFWATWCPPCREELPALRALARQPPAGVTVLTLGEDEPEEVIRAFFRGAPPPELGYRRDIDRRYATAFGVDVLPTAILVKDGRLAARFEGPQDWAAPGMKRLLARLAAGGAPLTQQGRPAVDAARGDQ
jgi:cytochrome c biogenesis protein CcmG, thiol:disulfide interchange protein DsbE